MAIRPTMLSLIGRVRQLINDPQSSTRIFDDQEIQDVLDESREDIVYQSLIAKPTYTSGAIEYLNYYSKIGGWEEDYTFLQYFSVAVVPSVLEPIAGHFSFSQSTYPPVHITGKLYDIHRSAADLLERLAAKYALQFAFSSDGQSFHPEQIQDSIDKLVKKYRMKQRTRTIQMTRSDLRGKGSTPSLEPTWIDYAASGDH